MIEGLEAQIAKLHAKIKVFEHARDELKADIASHQRVRFDSDNGTPSRVSAMRDVIRQIDGKFTSSNVRDLLKEHRPDVFDTFGKNTLTSLLYHLCQAQEIKPVEQQNGTHRKLYEATQKLYEHFAAK
jgi:hypothetical protein